MEQVIPQFILWIVTGIISVLIYLIWDRLRGTVSEKYCNKCSNGQDERIAQILDRLNTFESKVDSSISELRTLIIRLLGGVK